MPKKYTDFAESAPTERVAKHLASGSGHVRSYVSLTCPHCNQAFVEMPLECVDRNKASECLRHLRWCDQARWAGVDAPPRKRRAGDVSGPAREACQRTQLSAKIAECDALVARNSCLIERNDHLAARVGSLEEQIVSLGTQLADMRADLQRRDMRERARDNWERRVSEALGFQAPVSRVCGVPKWRME